MDNRQCRDVFTEEKKEISPKIILAFIVHVLYALYPRDEEPEQSPVVFELKRIMLEFVEDRGTESYGTECRIVENYSEKQLQIST